MLVYQRVSHLEQGHCPVIHLAIATACGCTTGVTALMADEPLRATQRSGCPQKNESEPKPAQKKNECQENCHPRKIAWRIS